MSSSTSWITSLECSPSVIHSSDSSSVSFVVNWLRFIFLSPCPQRVLLSCIDLLFLLTILGFGIKKIFSRFILRGNSSTSSINEPFLRNEKSRIRVTLWFYLSLIGTALLAICYTVLSILAFIQGIESKWSLVEASFRIAQAVTFATISVLIAHEKKFVAAVHPLSLRIYWGANFVIATLFAASAIIRMISHGGDLDASMGIDDIVSLVSFPISTFLFVIAIRGLSGICSIRESYEPNLMDSNISGYATASWTSKLFWLWMNPLLRKGYKSPLKIDDVPSLPTTYGAARMEELFELNWPKPEENSKNPVRTTIFRCFWKRIVFTGFLSVGRLAVMYVGPLLIQSFVSFANGEKTNPFEGYYLLTILLVAKVVEVLTSHHFTFESRKIGMLIRSSLIATLYKKGVKLSCSSRQSHGVGQITNYMAVDCQRLADAMANFHPIWTMPLQVGVALALLYGYMGASVIAASVAVVVVMFLTMWITRRTNRLMFHGMMSQDKRMKATNEMLSNMRVIKFQAWEEHFNKRIQSFRALEYGWLTKFVYSISLNSVVLSTITLVISALTFSVALLLGVPFDAGTVFTVTTLLRILQEPLQSFPQALVSLTQAMISLKRLDKYLTSQELDNGLVEREEGCDGRIAVEVRDGIFSWDDEGGEEVLKDVNLEIKKGDLAAIVGTVGSGKSSLLASIQGELNKLSGKVKVCGTTAYVAQTSWIQNATIQDNILFGAPMKKERYEEVIRVCCLQKDLEIMDHGDQTEIGERGINLSGGQKQRIQLARAVYQDCDIYLLDDVFSAVDAHTGSEIFKECLRGALKDKTILLVTHQVDFLHNSDLILVMRDGMIVQSGRYEELLESGLDFGALVAAHETSMELVEMSNTMPNDNPPQTPKSPHAPAIQGEPNGGRTIDQSKSEKSDSKIIEEEVRETGQINFEAYKQYWTQSFGWFGVAAMVLVSIMSQASTMSSDYWMQYETSPSHTFYPSLFISVYWIIVVLSGVFFTVRTFLVSYMGLKTAQSFFNQILHSMVHAPMSFFDTTPTGRILTRASNDQSMVDFFIPLIMSMSLLMYFQVLGTIFVTCQSAWPTVFLIIPLGWLNVWFRGYYLATSREITRLDSITKAPIIHHFSETIAGITTIRCFRKQEEFIRENIHRINANLRMEFNTSGSNEWLGFRLELMGTIVLCVATMFMIVLPNTIINPANIGLFLSYGLSLNIMLYYAVWTSTLVENRMISVERIRQFIAIASEAAWRIPGCLPSPNWPDHGDIEIKDLKVRYRPGTPLVLRGISVSINGGEKIGVVGRTGSGKSTLIQVFFRLVEPSGGKIIIDGVDICTLGLHDLRSRFAIIPQDPVLFEGTVRSNIDPIGLHSDEEIWKSLERCQLKDVVAAKPEKLSAPVVDSGENWSVGQRQLMCLGRIMLKHSRILFMDEATASVDSQTDALIQNIIREDFSACTIITIAHRIPTVIDCDKVLVLDAGLAKEFDKPTNLIGRPTLFGALVKEYAARSVDA